jgi:hypothetical protein
MYEKDRTPWHELHGTAETQVGKATKKTAIAGAAINSI